MSIIIISGVLTASFVLVDNKMTNESNNELVKELANQDKELNRQIEVSIEDYEKLLYSDKENTVVIFPIFTGFAYNEGVFMIILLNNVTNHVSL